MSCVYFSAHTFKWIGSEFEQPRPYHTWYLFK